MKIRSHRLLGAAMLAFAVCSTSTALAQVPVPPPVQQQIGLDDVTFGVLEQAECRFCHEDPSVVEDAAIPARHHILYGTPIPPGSQAPTQTGEPGETYNCTTCHFVHGNFGDFRNCPTCHLQGADGTVHHLTAKARAGDCSDCHGDIVDSIGDGHYIPSYAPSLLTPRRSRGTGLPRNSRNKGAGACDYCHDSGVSPEGVAVERTLITHHLTGFFAQGECFWCHELFVPFNRQIRRCENCHGPESLHNIQLDSNGDGIIPGQELPNYGHIGNNSDCWGCHGFSDPAPGAAPFAGAMAPAVAGVEPMAAAGGQPVDVTVQGAAFRNVVPDPNGGPGIPVEAAVEVVDADGVVWPFEPQVLEDDMLVFTLPPNMPLGNYKVRAVKGAQASNPAVITLVPPVYIDAAQCNGGVITIDGESFGQRPEGTEPYLTVSVDGVALPVLSWTDTQIQARIGACPAPLAVTVRALFATVSWGS